MRPLWSCQLAGGNGSTELHPSLAVDSGWLWSFSKPSFLICKTSLRTGPTPFPGGCEGVLHNSLLCSCSWEWGPDPPVISLLLGKRGGSFSMLYPSL